MIRILEEAIAKAQQAQPVKSVRAKISDVLNPYLSNEQWKEQSSQITNLIKAIDTVQPILKGNAAALTALQAGVDSIAFSLSESSNPEKLKGNGWTVLPADAEKAILTISEIRNWILDRGISMSDITSSLNAIANDAAINKYEAQGNVQEAKPTAGGQSAFVSAVDAHTEQNEIQNGSVGHIKVKLNCPGGCNTESFKYIVEALYQQGRKGKGWNQFGSYERLLSVMTHGAYFPQDGSEGAGDITCGGDNIYAEVKCIDGSSLMTSPEIPAGGGGKNCLLMVLSKNKSDHSEFDVLIFRTQEMIDALCKRTKGKKEVKLNVVKSLLSPENGNEEMRNEIELVDARKPKNIVPNGERSVLLKKSVDDWVNWNLKAIKTSGNRLDADAANSMQYGMLQKNKMLLKKLSTLVTCCSNWINNGELNPKGKPFEYTRGELKKLISDKLSDKKLVGYISDDMKDNEPDQEEDLGDEDSDNVPESYEVIE